MQVYIFFLLDTVFSPPDDMTEIECFSTCIKRHQGNGGCFLWYIYATPGQVDLSKYAIGINQNRLWSAVYNAAQKRLEVAWQFLSHRTDALVSSHHLSWINFMFFSKKATMNSDKPD